MQKKEQTLKELRYLRERALISPGSRDKVDLLGMTTSEVATLVHDLETHRVELELQNEELRRYQEELTTMRDQYAELYNFAPVGYVTTGKKGIIIQANLTFGEMLAFPPGGLVEEFFHSYIFKEDQDIYYKHRKQVLATGKKQCCELRLIPRKGEPFWARIESSTEDGPNSKEERIRSTLSDITELHDYRNHLKQLVEEKT